MGLINCPFCGREISDRTDSCNFCGKNITVGANVNQTTGYLYNNNGNQSNMNNYTANVNGNNRPQFTPIYYRSKEAKKLIVAGGLFGVIFMIISALLVLVVILADNDIDRVIAIPGLVISVFVGSIVDPLLSGMAIIIEKNYRQLSEGRM